LAVIALRSKNRRGSDRIFGDVFEVAAAFGGVALGAPAQHAAGKIGDVAEAGLAQDRRRPRSAAAGPAHWDDRPVGHQLPGAFGQDRASSASDRLSR
jgi:hypothetical protein